MPTATPTAGSASFTANGGSACRRRCGRRTWRARSCSSTGLATRCRSLIRRRARSTRAHLRRGTRRVELHLCRGALERDAARLDRCARQRARRDRRRAEGDRARQSQGRHHQAVALRAGHQPDVPGPRRPLRLRRAAGARDEAARQGQGRGRRADRSRFVLAKLRNRRFFSLAELNAAIRDCVAKINAKVMSSSARAATSCWRGSTGRR